jgi:EAL domain-containing protein (putative c-di-GMP-specific phosphodiesterase class I)/GGDEF domain-containing protein
MKNMMKTDFLTGLYSGINIEDALRDFYQEEADPGRQYNFVCLSIVSFDRFNRLFGHTRGDRLLTILGSAIKNACYCGIRISGDSFAFLSGDCLDPAGELERRFREELEISFEGSHLAVIDLKMGIYPIDPGEIPGREIFDRALLALALAKNLSGRQAVYFDGKLKEEAALRQSIEMNMLQAFSRDEFQIYIQPKYALPGKTCLEAEALIRWWSDGLGTMIPDQFIPVFEHNGFIVEVDFFVLSSVFKIIQRQLNEGRSVLPISVNQSRASFSSPDYVRRIRGLTEAYPIPLKYIQLEVTETILEDERLSLLEILADLKHMGFSIALDDFGAGYASLNSLKDFPVDTLKIDRDLLNEDENSFRGKAIIRSIVRMSKELGIKVVCEGVETEEQLAFLSNIGCDYAQGFYCAPPMPLAEYEGAYLRAPSC